MTDDALRLLSALGEGEDNAMTRGALCALLGLPDRTVRKLIEEARRDELAHGAVPLSSTPARARATSSPAMPTRSSVTTAANTPARWRSWYARRASGNF